MTGIEFSPFFFHVLQCRCHLFMFIDRTSLTMEETEWKAKGKRESGVRFASSPLIPTDQFPSHRASNLHTAQTNPSLLTRPCNSTHWRPDQGRLKMSSRPHKCSYMHSQMHFTCIANTHSGLKSPLMCTHLLHTNGNL